MVICPIEVASGKADEASRNDSGIRKQTFNELIFIKRVERRFGFRSFRPVRKRPQPCFCKWPLSGCRDPWSAPKATGEDICH